MHDVHDDVSRSARLRSFCPHLGDADWHCIINNSLDCNQDAHSSVRLETDLDRYAADLGFREMRGTRKRRV